MRGLLLLLMLGCATPKVRTTASDPVAVETRLDGDGALLVRVVHDPTLEVELPVPEVEGLSFVPDGDPIVERLGSRTVITQRYRFGGEPGSYEIGALQAHYTDANGESTEASSSPIFVDLNVASPREGELADISDPPRVWAVPWRGVALVSGAVLALGAVGGLLVGGTLFAFRRPEPVEQEPPDIAALRRWESVREDASVTPYDKAVALSRIFRDYAQVVLGFPAGAWTTTETLAHLTKMEHLPKGNVPRAKRLLRATDRIKFADASAGDDVLDELDADLRAFVGSTRPQRWDAELPR